MRLLAALAALTLTSVACLCQEEGKTWIDKDGNKQTIDPIHGYWEVRKDGKTSNLSRGDLDSLCRNLDDFPAVAQSTNGATIVQLCDMWALLKPRTKIEKLHTDGLVSRLLLLSPPSTDFTRYRGVALKSDASSITYDSLLVPDDLGEDTTCTITEENRAELGMLYTFGCTQKMSSYGMAVSKEKSVAYELARHSLPEEDQAREHGLYAHAKEMGLCAPTGECALEHTFITVRHDGKQLQIEAWPEFTRDTIPEIIARESGKHSAVSGIDPSSGSMSLEVMSVGPSLPEAEWNKRRAAAR